MEKKKTKAPVDPQIVWGSKASDHLVGMQVGAVSYLTKEECDALGWYESCAVIEFFDPKGKKKNVWVYASRDDEGNGAVALYTNISDLPIIPVIPCG